ncbi:phage holin family protein [Aestuariimicrobium kwangyangense]|uniref:phage holin family protein n=1 Tax=Aestuariimicrobium kwangyangense TaxID=396389 RepID=UPI0003B38654|nr:phage holin family protein [Aestuariimicrobium kwangyangense]
MTDRLQVGDVINNLKTDVPQMLNDNVALAKAEIQPAVKHAGIGSGMFGTAGYFAMNALSLLFLTGAFAFSLLFNAAVGLGVLLSLIIGFALMAVVCLLVAGMLGMIGMKQFKQVKKPEATIAELQTTAQALGAAIKQGQAAVNGNTLAKAAVRHARRAL